MEGIRINGTTSLDYTEYAGVKYIFFGDFHVSQNQIQDPNHGKECEKCISNVKCTDIQNVLKITFNNAQIKNKGVEFFLEKSFKKTELMKHNKSYYEIFGENYLDPIANKLDLYLAGYSESEIFKLEAFFRLCFEKKSKCEYKNVLFHYSDIRSEFRNEEYIKLGFEEYFIDKIVNTLKDIKRGIKFKSYKLERLYQQIFLSKVNGQSISYELYRLYLTSDDIENDVLSLFKDVDIKNIQDLLLAKNMIVKRDGKTVHRIRSQILALEKEGKNYLAGRIVQFILDRYSSLLANILHHTTDIINSLNIFSSEMEKSDNLDYRNYFDQLKEAARKMTWQMIKNQAFIMDAYTLPRLFRNFTIPDTNIKTSKKIFHGGGFHIYTYVDFLKTLGAKVKTYKQDNFKKCITISDADYLWITN